MVTKQQQRLLRNWVACRATPPPTSSLPRKLFLLRCVVYLDGWLNRQHLAYEDFDKAPVTDLYSNPPIVTPPTAVTASPCSSAPTAAFPDFESLSGRYSVIRLLGQGAFGTTYLVEREPGHLFAVKEISCNSDKQRNIALQEVTAFARVPPSPYIVGFEEVFLRTPPERPGTNVCLVLTFCGGPTLDTILLRMKEKGTCASEEQICRWLRDMCQGLHVIHAAGLVHRDIKSDNILSHEDGRLVIGDLGLLRSINCPCKLFIAFKYYAAPEVTTSRNFSPASDMFALGCVLLEIVSGVRMRDRGAERLPSSSATVVEEELRSIGRRSVYSAELLGLISALLRHAPDARPSAAQLLRCGEMWNSAGDLRGGVTLTGNTGYFGVC